MVKYEWLIPALERSTAEKAGKPDIVTVAHWRLVASEGDLSVEAYGSAPLPAPGSDFVAYADLTQETVVSWLEELLEVDKIKADLAARLAELAAPKSVTDTPPWS